MQKYIKYRKHRNEFHVKFEPNVKCFFLFFFLVRLKSNKRARLFPYTRGTFYLKSTLIKDIILAITLKYCLIAWKTTLASRLFAFFFYVDAPVNVNYTYYLLKYYSRTG